MFVVLGVAACGGTAASTPPSAAPSPSAAPPVSASASAVASASTAAEPAIAWPAPSDPLERAVAAGLEPADREHLAHHVHSHLDVFVDGKKVVVPAGIGINIDDPAVRHFENPIGYGGIEQCAQPCISPLHTHDETGILHTESRETRANTLGQFFTEWGVKLSQSCVADYCDPTPVAVYVNGVPYDGDPAAIELTDQRVIVIAVGTPPDEIPSTADFSGA
ncbi:MAG: hypothetical protein ACJ77D_03290 [Chloroflexota bacterium]